MPKDVKVLVTGGHITPAVATIEALSQFKVQITLVGREKNNHLGSPARESILAKQLGVQFMSLKTAKFTRYAPWQFISHIPQLLGALVQANEIISKLKPHIILSFGGYVALPVAAMAAIRGIPIITHEQTTIMGLANQLISKLATHTVISWPKTLHAPQNALLVGNPLRAELLEPAVKPTWFKPVNLPLIYVTGGSQGAQAINQAIFDQLAVLLEKYQLVHQTGDTRNKADYHQAQQLKKSLPSHLQSRYTVKTWLEADEVSWLLTQASVVVSRSGANTITDLLSKKAKAVLVPLPISARREQQHNARRYVQLGLGVYLDQTQLNQLGQQIETCQQLPAPLTPQIQKLQKLHTQAANKLAQIVLTCVAENPTSA